MNTKEQDKVSARTLKTFNCPVNHGQTLRRNKSVQCWWTQEKTPKKKKNAQSGELVYQTPSPPSLFFSFSLLVPLYINKRTVKCLFLQGATSKSITSLRPLGRCKPRSNSISNYHNEKKHLGTIWPGLHHTKVWYWSLHSLFFFFFFSFNQIAIQWFFLTAQCCIYVDDTVEYIYVMSPRVKCWWFITSASSKDGTVEPSWRCWLWYKLLPCGNTNL